MAPTLKEKLSGVVSTPRRQVPSTEKPTTPVDITATPVDISPPVDGASTTVDSIPGYVLDSDKLRLIGNVVTGKSIPRMNNVKTKQYVIRALQKAKITEGRG